MKITSKADLSAFVSSKAPSPSAHSDLFQTSKSQRPLRRKSRSPRYSGAGVRLKKDGAPPGKRSRPETPLLRWKFDGGAKGGVFKEGSSPPELVPRSNRKVRGGGKEAVVSARKLAAVLWWLQEPEVPPTTGRRRERFSLPKNDRLGFQYGACHIDIGLPFSGNHNSRAHSSGAKDLMSSPRSLSAPRNGYLCKFDPTSQLSNSAMEGATKWDPICTKTSGKEERIYGHSKHLNQQVSVVPAISAMEVELEQAQARIHELETEKRSSKKKLEHFLRKLSEERATWRSREHEKIRAIIDDVKADLNRERKNRQRLEIVNSKLVNELADTKLLAKRYIQDYEKERKGRELIEEVCDELAKEIGEDKAEVEALKRESMKLCEEVENERKMLQMAEVWREERVQMKLVDAKVMLEEKYSQMNKLVADLEAFLISRSAATQDVEEEMRKAEFLQQAANSMNIQDIKEFTYEPPNSDNIFSVFEGINFGGANDKESEVNVLNEDTMHINSNAYIDQSGDEEDEGSGWETVSQAEDQGSSYSPDGSIPSVNKIRHDVNMSGSRTEWEENACKETPATEISEVCVAPKTHFKKVSSISRLWRSCPNNGENFRIISVEETNGRLSNGRLSNGSIVSPDRGSVKSGIIPADLNGRLSNGRLSNGSIVSPDRGSVKSGISPAELVGQWSSPDSGNNPHIARGMKGCIEWPRGVQKSSLKAKLLEARMESQKIQLKQVLKQKI
ncbi:hypothetical protein U1Q18_000457 [Sarracenia purpurea var. burkii]